MCALRRLASAYWSKSDPNREMVQRLVQLEQNLKATAAFSKWRWNRQQDANEYYLHVLNALIERTPA